ncbi:hypothetical protein IEQ34_010558 [Dendrobium chrysotoxum]|uniref:Uncharacterized protein n=1 Tax=Dendrobium chrysotoxum TaxID=161865 RepID=A0AAV7GUY1_DENCH|nr:hypothetical protein IEQ34_010558 [Dendrobium chrysotoxum]
MKNEWVLRKKWGRLKELPHSPNIREEEILKILNSFDIESLQHELRYISRCVTEESLFKVELSIQAGRSHAIQLKKSEKIPEANSNVLKRSVSHSSEVKDLEHQSLEKGFTHGFLKGVRLVHHKTRVDIEGLTTSQAFEDSPVDSGDDGIESELKKAFSSDDDYIEIA